MSNFNNWIISIWVDERTKLVIIFLKKELQLRQFNHITCTEAAMDSLLDNEHSLAMLCRIYCHYKRRWNSLYFERINLFFFFNNHRIFITKWLTVFVVVLFEGICCSATFSRSRNRWSSSAETSGSREIGYKEERAQTKELIIVNDS